MNATRKGGTSGSQADIDERVVLNGVRDTTFRQFVTRHAALAVHRTANAGTPLELATHCPLSC